jgi:light-regulated signal transduction histidine kinase (bacteriophytochrome)
LQDTIEELETSSEELQSLNEELQSSNEELQASNEELNTVIDELRAKSEEAAELLEELKISEKRYRLLVDNMNEGIISCEIEYGPKNKPTDLIITQANRAFKQLIGFEGHNLPVRAGVVDLHELVTEDMFARFADITQGGASQRFELHFEALKKDLIVSVYRLDEGQLGIACHDDTDRKRADMLEESNLRLKDFVHAASRDLQEPLRKIQTFADRILTLNSTSMDQQACDSLERLQRSASNMQDLILGLLEYSRVHSCSPSFTKFNLWEPIEEVAAHLSLLFEEKDGRVEISDLPEVDADRVQMYQLFQNLIGNSLKFTGPEKPVVRIYADAATTDGFREIVVEDNGIGFDERYLDQIFKPLKRLHPKNSPYEGTGIGLALCQSIVERHGGTIAANSQPGKGATFIVMLPEKQPVKEKPK